MPSRVPYYDDSMATIDVEREGDAFRVRVQEGKGATTHRVTLKAADQARLARPGETPEAFLQRCFEFLLEREPKESIMSSFDVMVIARYFPEFESTIRK
jgi:hypothetical protein